MSTLTHESPWPERWQRFKAASVRGFHAYAGWLVGISWKRFILLSLAFLIAMAMLQDLPLFRWTTTEKVAASRHARTIVVTPPAVPAPPAPPGESKPLPSIQIETPKSGSKSDGVEISINSQGIRIVPKAPAGASAASSAHGGMPASAATAGQAAEPMVSIRLPEGATSESVREAVAEAKRDIQEAVREAQRDAADAMREAARDAAEAARDATNAAREVSAAWQDEGPTERTRTIKLLNGLPELAMLWILGSAIIKVTYKQQIKAEAQAAQAVETAEAESLKRQVVEARMAAMQAQVEPHFLFNTLASIDHLIEVDPKRASVMQKNLIALLRASMPTMREAGDGGSRDLGRELSVIRPYLEILKVRMEERLSTEIDVPEGLLSAEFPQMMVQTLVENAIKHGLEPKPEGGSLKVKAEIVHGKLVVSVADTGLGFGRAATAGTGVGLANIRERLQLLYGAKASLSVTENPGGGTVVTVTVPYKPLQGEAA
ncbi:MAG: histidine kinase [Ideonella sp.]|nr:histidine kinase [Ideonella sp.]